MNSSYQWILHPRLIWMVLLAFAVFSISPPPARAALIESQLSGGHVVSQRVDDLETVRQTLEHELVAQRLVDYGFSKEEVQLKLQSLSDAQIHQLASVSDSLAEGASSGVELAVGLLVVVLLVILILKVSDKQIIVK